MTIVINNGMIKYAEKLLEISKIVAQRKKWLYLIKRETCWAGGVEMLLSVGQR